MGLNFTQSMIQEPFMTKHRFPRQPNQRFRPSFGITLYRFCRLSMPNFLSSQHFLDKILKVKLDMKNFIWKLVWSYTHSYTDDVFITWYLFSHAEQKSDKLMTCLEVLAGEFYHVRAFVVLDKFIWFFIYCYLSSLLLLTWVFWPFNCKELPSVKPKLDSATGVDWITVS